MNKGFTLIELLVVVLIVGILSAVALPQYQTAVERSRATEALSQMSAIRESMERYRSQREAWPLSLNKLDVDTPKTVSGDYGGKHFSIYMSTNTVCAQRFGAHPYTLCTVITEDADNGTFTSYRTCSPSSGDAHAQDYCNAISGGKEYF